MTAFLPILSLHEEMKKLELTINLPFITTFWLVQPVTMRLEVLVTEVSLVPMVMFGTKFSPICWQSVCWAGAGLAKASRNVISKTPKYRNLYVGVLECWSVGVLECWSVGVLEC